MFHSFVPSTTYEPSVHILTATVGDGYFEQWSKFSWPSWERYATAHNYAVHCLIDSLSEPGEHLGWNKFLGLEHLVKQIPRSATVLILDADQIISPLAPKLPTGLADGLIGVVPETPPADRRILSFLRRAHLNPNYPLDSIAVAEQEDWASIDSYSQFAKHQFFSSGFVLVPSAGRNAIIEFARTRRSNQFDSIDNSGDQFGFIELANSISVTDLSPKWQGIWPEIMAKRYPFLYVDRDPLLGARAVASALLEFHVIHFSTSLSEKDFWHIDHYGAWEEILENPSVGDLGEYLSSTLTPRMYGRITKDEASFFDGFLEKDG